MSFLVKDAIEYQKLNLGITYLLISKNSGKLLSYTTFCMGALKLPERMDEFVFKGKRLKDYPKDFPNQFPALLIGKLATDKREVGKGGAGFLLDFAVKTAFEIRSRIGCAYMVAHAYTRPDIIKWYENKGFGSYLTDAKGRDTIPMYFEL